MSPKRYNEKLQEKLGQMQTYLLAINRINRIESTVALYKKAYLLESQALKLVSPLNLITTLNKNGQVALNYFYPSVNRGDRPPLPAETVIGPINM